MEHIGKQLAAIEQNIKINSTDPTAVHGFTQVPNFILNLCPVNVRLAGPTNYPTQSLSKRSSARASSWHRQAGVSMPRAADPSLYGTGCRC
jgi:hypothetical protein